jgi:hypothetical protein
MKTKAQIEERLVEIKGELQRLDNKEALFGSLGTAEEYEVADMLVAERDALEWVVRP